jgi:capsule polysaccharide export protein KpsE/RkpR
VVEKDTETGWNFNTFEKYVNQRFEDAEKAVSAALIASEKAVNKAEGAQQLRNESQNEFRKSLSDLSGLMWTTKEGTATVDSLRRELTIAINNLDTKITSLNSARTDAVESMRKALDARIAPLEANAANIQGRIWGVSALFAITALVIDVGVHYIGH